MNNNQNTENNVQTEMITSETVSVTESVEESEVTTVAKITIDEEGNLEVNTDNNYETNVTNNSDSTDEITVTEIEKTDEGINLFVKPEEFVNNLGYMGKGMFGIFIVIGVIIATVYAISGLGKKNN